MLTRIWAVLHFSSYNFASSATIFPRLVEGIVLVVSGANFLGYNGSPCIGLLDIFGLEILVVVG